MQIIAIHSANFVINRDLEMTFFWQPKKTIRLKPVWMTQQISVARQKCSQPVVSMLSVQRPSVLPNPTGAE